MSIKVRYPANISLVQVVREDGSLVSLSNGDEYGYLPYWIKITDVTGESESEPQIEVEFFEFERLPEGLREYLQEQRE